MERHPTRLLLALGVVVLAVGVALVLRTRLAPSTGTTTNDVFTDVPNTNELFSEESSDVAATVSVLAEYGDGRVVTYPEVAVTDPTVLAALRQASADPTDPFTLTADASGIVELGGVRSGSDRRWHFWVNNQLGDDPTTFEIGDGDVLTVSYVKPQPSVSQESNP